MDEANVRQVLASLGVGRVHRSKKWLNSTCPLAPYTHERGVDRSPSFGIAINESGPSAYKCHSCKYTGRVSSLVRLLERYGEGPFPGLALQADMADASVFTGEFDDVDDPYEEVPEPLNEAAYGDLYPPANEVDVAREYLDGRGIGEATATLLDLRYDASQRRVLFPVRGPDNGLYGFSGRSVLSKDALAQAGKKHPKVRDYLDLPKRHMLLGAERVRPGKPILAVEGLMGWASLFEHCADDLMQPVALMGSEMTDEKARLLIEWGLPVYLLTDNDLPGDTCLFGRQDSEGVHVGGGAIDKLYDHLPLYVPLWPEGLDDPDQLVFEDIETMLRETPLYIRPGENS